MSYLTHRSPDDSGDGYDVGLACLNGHAVNGSSQNLPQFNAPFCGDCGAKAIDECPKCAAKLRGSYWGNFSTESWAPKPYCYNCGKAYSWTEARLAAASALVDDAEQLTPEEREQLKASFEDLTTDVPATIVAASRFKRLATKAGATTASALKDVLVELVSESAKRTIWGS